MTRAVPMLTALVATVALAAGCAAGGSEPGGGNDPGGARSAGASAPVTPSPTTSSTTSSATSSTAAQPLAGKVVVLDPGHQLGNRNHASEISEPVDAGGVDKDCNTTGTATSSGYSEATFNWRVAAKLRRQLRALGAQVVMTRSGDSDDAWGPCIDERGSIGNPDEAGPRADVRISIHADGVTDSEAHGFHVIRPGVLDGWTDDISRPSRRLATACRDALVAGGFTTASYTGDNGIDVRTDLGTLNHSDVPVVMLELGNMRNDDEAALMETDAGQRRYAGAILAGLQAWLTR